MVEIITVRVTVKESQGPCVASAISQLAGFGYIIRYVSVNTKWKIIADKEALELLIDWMAYKA